MKYAQVKHLPSPQFKRLVGVRHQTFRSMVWVMRTQTPPKLKSGRPSRLSLEGLLPGKKWLLRGHEIPAIVIVDGTSTPIERPKRRQKQFYSGKKKTHTLKSQIVVDQQSRAIICTAHDKGRQHDFRLWQVSGVQLHPSTQGLGEKG